MLKKKVRNFKYRINALLHEKPGTLKEKVETLASSINLSPHMVNKIRLYKWGDNGSANTDQIWAIAQYYNTTPANILNPPPDFVYEEKATTKMAFN